MQRPVVLLASIVALTVAACSDNKGSQHHDDDDDQDDGANHLLSLTVDGSGKVTSDPAGLDCGDGGTVCDLEVPAGTFVRLFAAVEAHHHIGTWGAPACPTTSATCDVTPHGDLTLAVEFPIDTFALNVTGDGGFVVTSTPAGIDCGATCSADFAYGTEIVLSVGDDLFARWSGECDGAIGDCTLTVNDHVLDVGIFDVRTRISEVLFDAPGTDGDNQFVELDCTPDTALAGFLTIIDGDAADAGEVLFSQTLAGITCGSAGFVILQRGSVYSGVAGVTYANAFFTDELQNGSQTYLITETAVTAGTDVDTNNDGSLDISLPAITSGVGVIDNNSTDRGYSTPTFRLSDNSGAFARFAGTSGSQTRDWYYGTIIDNPSTPPPFIYSANVSNNFPDDGALTPGEPNQEQAP